MFKKVTNYTILFALTCSQAVLAGGEGPSEHYPEYSGMRRHYQPTPARKAHERSRKHLVLRLRTHGKKDGDNYQSLVSVTAKKARIEADTMAKPYTTLEKLEDSLDLDPNRREKHDFSNGKYGMWATHEQGYIGGGTGLDHEYIDPLSGETRHINMGLRMRAGGRITNDFSAIDSIASIHMDAVKGFENLSDTHPYPAHYRVNKKRFKGTKYKYIWDVAVARAQVRARKRKLFINVSNDDIYSSSGLFYSGDGTDLSAKDDVRFEDAVTEREEIFLKTIA